MTISIGPVRARRELDEFVTVPRRLYTGMPGFVAPLDHERHELLDPKKAAFYTHGEAAYWIARHNGRAVGRISAQIDHLADGPDASRLGFFGCFDAIQDQEVANALLTAAEEWLRVRGCARAQGPYLLSINGETGLLIEGFDTPPMTLMPWHPPYLVQLLRSASYGQVQSVSAYDLDFTNLDSQKLERATGRFREKSKLSVRGMKVRELDAEAELARQIFNDAWSQNWGFIPFSSADIRAVSKGFKPFLFADSMVVVEQKGEPLGFALALPNLFEIVGDLGGSPGPVGWLRFLLRVLRGKYKGCRVILMGIRGAYRGTPLGAEIAMLLIGDLVRRGRARGLTHVEAGWILQDNAPMIRILQAFDFRKCRTYGIFEKALVEDPANLCGAQGAVEAASR